MRSRSSASSSQENRRARGIENLQARDEDFHLARLQLGIDVARLAVGHLALHADDVFAAQRIGGGMGGGLHVGLEHHLHQPRVIAQIHKDHAAVVAARVDPAHQHHGRPDMACAQFAAVMGAKS
jgi:hypothetical protein